MLRMRSDFFYVEAGSSSEKSVKQNLQKAAQFVSPSPIGSDYILKTNAAVLSDDHTLTLNIILKDSLTLKTIYETNEKYSFGPVKSNPQIILHLAINNFIERNLNQIILTANGRHSETLLKNVR